MWKLKLIIVLLLCAFTIQSYAQDYDFKFVIEEHLDGNNYLGISEGEVVSIHYEGSRYTDYLKVGRIPTSTIVSMTGKYNGTFTIDFVLNGTAGTLMINSGTKRMAYSFAGQTDVFQTGIYDDTKTSYDDKKARIFSGRYLVVGSSLSYGYPEYVMISGEDNTITNGTTLSVTKLKYVKWNEKNKVFEGQYEAETPYGSTRGTFILNKSSYTFSVGNSIVTWEIEEDKEYLSKLQKQKDEENRLRIQKQREEEEKRRLQYERDTENLNFVNNNLLSSSIEELSNHYIKIIDSTIKRKCYELILSRLFEEVNDTVKIDGGDKYKYLNDYYLPVLKMVPRGNLKTSEVKIVFDKTGRPTSISGNIFPNKTPSLPESIIPTKKIHNLFDVPVNSILEFQIDSTVSLDKTRDEFYSIKNIRGKSALRQRSNGTLYRPSFLKNSVTDKRVACFFSEDIEKRNIVRKNTYYNVNYYLDTKQLINTKGIIRFEESKMSRRIPKQVWRSTSLIYWSLILITLI